MTEPHQRLFDRWATMYDAIYAARGMDYRAEAAQIMALDRRHGEARSLLDVACGTGEHLSYLRDHVEHVEGVDQCSAMLDVARGKLPGVRLHHGDMRDFALNRRFDVVTCLFASIGYLPDLDAMGEALRRMIEHLEPGGRLYLEAAITRERLRPPQTSTMELATAAGQVRRTTSSEVLPEVLRIHFDYEITRPGEEARFRETHDMRLLAAAQYAQLLDAAGATDIDVPDGGLAGRELLIARRV